MRPCRQIGGNWGCRNAFSWLDDTRMHTEDIGIRTYVYLCPSEADVLTVRRYDATSVNMCAVDNLAFTLPPTTISSTQARWLLFFSPAFLLPLYIPYIPTYLVVSNIHTGIRLSFSRDRFKRMPKSRVSYRSIIRVGRTRYSRTLTRYIVIYLIRSRLR